MNAHEIEAIVRQYLPQVTSDSPPYKAVLSRLGLGPEILDDADTDSGHGFYQITVSDFDLFDSYGSGPPCKHQLSWEKEN